MLGKFKKKSKEAAAAEAEDDDKDGAKKAQTSGEESAESDGGAAAEEEGKASSKKKKLIIAAAAVVVLLGAGAGVYFSGVLKSHDASQAEATDEHGAAKKEKHAGPTPSVFMELPELVVNLNTSSRQSSFLKMVIALEISSEEEKATIEANMPKILDTFNTYLRELRASDLYGSAGIYRLREELMSRINKIVAPTQVKDILFKQVLIQ